MRKEDRGGVDVVQKDLSAHEVLEKLPGSLVTTLERCYGAPEGVAELVFQGLPYGFRHLVIAYGLAEETENSELVLTPFAFECIGKAAAESGVPYADMPKDELMKRADELVARLNG